MSRYYVGVDVGTASVRAALVTRDGHVTHTAEEPVNIWEPCADHYEQSSEDIWSKCCRTVKRVTQDVDVESVRGIGFDATCSLVALDRHFQPVAVNHTGRRSLCTLVCKWTYSPSDGWDDSFWSAIGLEDLMENSYSKIGQQACCPGAPVGRGLTAAAAADLGLIQGTAVGASLIDAHAGGLGLMGADVTGHHLPCEHRPVSSRMALICGTSSCHMAVSTQPLFVPGVWGPYLSAMLPGLWLNEGGQSATGRLVEHVVRGHAAYRQLEEQAERSGKQVYSYLNTHLEGMSADAAQLEQLTARLHVWPDFHGNRSPLADQTARGVVVGLTLSQTLDDLALLYLATLQAIALGTRHIIDAMRAAGHDITTLFLCGGLSKNALFVQTHANTTGLPVVLPAEREAVLLGAAVIGACASSDCSSIQEAMRRMTRIGRVVRPNPGLESFYRRKYTVFLRLYDHQKECVALMETEAV
ncbi:FGGY carbohydrate kinase domain-containing protein [Sinocyclocheilus grahami]|uniref:FGGY carbohydrate kinase domain-containing protein n=1 Tax=Sinocyclocheilus grahami TaxID=75366 RepID=UPI0007AD4C46|nr:PREDICTED: FGGY carbohydrate kinase domain-containing protein [Sinocyclocheilus grahami]